MDPFRIVCPSCSSKIMVRHAHLVGQTLPCPKCALPLQVVAPVDPQFPAPVPETLGTVRTGPLRGPVVNSDAITKADPADWNMDQLDGNPLPDFAPWSANAPQQEPIIVRSPGASAETLGESRAATHLAPGKWESKNAVARRNLLLVASIAGGGLLLATLFFVAFIRAYGKPGERIVANTDTESVAGSVEVPPALTPVELPSNEPDSTSTDANATEPKVTATDTDNSDGASTFPATENIAALEATTPLSPAESSEKNQLESPASETKADDNLPSIFQDFQRMFDAPSRNNWDDVGKADRTIANEISIEQGEVLFREEYYPASIPIPNWSERAERVLGSVRTKPMSLLRCIDWFSKVSNVGITVDWFDMNLAGVDLSESVTIEGQNQSIGAMLDAICQAKGLEVVTDAEGFPHVRPTVDRVLVDGSLRSDDFDGESILASLPQDQRESTIRLVIKFLDMGSCQYVDGKLEWSKEAPYYDKARLLASIRVLLETVSAQKGAPTFPIDSMDFARPGAWFQTRERVQATVPMNTFVYEDRPVIDLLATAAAASDTLLVIDWPAVWSHGFFPSRMSVSVLRGRTLEEISNRYLEDYALELVPLDSKTVLLTTDRVRRAIERVVAVRLDQGMNADDIKGTMRSLVPRGIDQRSRFMLQVLPSDENVALLRICLPALVHLRDRELQKAFGQKLE